MENNISCPFLGKMQYFPVINPRRRGKVIAKSKAKEVKRKWHATALWFLKTRTSSATSSLRWNGDLTSREAGSIGGEMVKRMIEYAEKNMH